MKLTPKCKVDLLIAGLVLLTSCSSSPKKQRIKYLTEGEKSFKAGKHQEAVIDFRNAYNIDASSAAAHYAANATAALSQISTGTR